MGLIWFLLIIGVSIFVHELGHYLAARLQGVSVPRFSIGLFGPVLLRFSLFGTEFRLTPWLLGGYAEIEGMGPEISEGEPRVSKQGFARIRLPGKLVILLAGILMNLLLGWGLFTVYLAHQGKLLPGARIVGIVPDSPAAKLGLKPGDIVSRLDGTKLKTFTDLGLFKRHAGRHTFTIERNGEDLQLGFDWEPSERILGVEYAPVHTGMPVLEAAAVSGQRLVSLFPNYVRSVLRGIGDVLIGHKDSNIVGPVGIVGLAAEAGRQGWAALVMLTTVINFSLAVFNLLPIPGLDGGWVLLTLLNTVSRGRITPERQAILNFIGLAFVLLLFILVTFQDIGSRLGGS